MKIPKHYSLKQDNPDHYVLHDKRDNTEFKIAKYHLEDYQHKQIAKIPKFAEGGVVGDPLAIPSLTGYDPNDANKDWKGQPKDQGKTKDQPVKMWGGGDVGGVPDPELSSQYNKDQTVFPSENVTGNKPTMDQSEQPAVPPIAQEDQTAQAIPSEAPRPPNALSQVTPFNLKEFQQTQQAGEAAEYNLGKEKGALSKEESGEYKNLGTLLQSAQDAGATKAAVLSKQNDSLFNSILNQKIDPNQYINNMSTTNKIISAIAIGLGGGFSGMTGQPNPALGMLNDAITRNIEAQKSDLGKKQTLYSENLKRYNDERLATAATFSNLSTIAQAKIQEIASQHGDPIAKQNAALMLSTMHQDNMIKMQGITQDSALQQFKNQAIGSNIDPATDPAQLVPFLVPKELQKDAYAEIDSAKAKTRLAPEILDAFDKAASSVNAADFVPGMENAYQKKFMALLGTTLKETEGTAREFALHNVESTMKPQFGDIAATKVKRDALVNYLNDTKSYNVLRGNNINPDRFQQTASPKSLSTTQQQYLDYARKYPQAPGSQQILKKYGGQ